MEQRIIQERGRIQTALLDSETTPQQYNELYAAQQALAWVENPQVAKSPYRLIMDTPASSEGCSADLRPPLS
jgi:hypothetical protein